MKQWKLVLVALLSVLLVCTCMSALAEETTHTHEWDWNKAVKVSDATCTSPATYKAPCKDATCKEYCDPYTWGNTVDHVWYVTKTVAGSCITPEQITYSCKNCSATKTDDGKKNPSNHTSKKTTVVDPTCTIQGSEVVTCEGCGVTLSTKVLSATGHNWVLKSTSPATCVAGNQHYECSKCDATNDVPVAATRDHEFEKVAGGVPATCTVGGTQNYKCKYCTKTKTETTKALGHKGKTTTANATCTEDGETKTVCESCGYIMASKTIAKLGHVEVDQVYVRPTCKTQGLKNVLCTRCGKTVKSAVTVAATGHNGKWIVKKAATAKEDGVKELVCQNINSDGKICGEVLDKKAIKYAEMMYNNTITSFGPCTRDLIGGKTWNRVTPVDLSVDGTYTYDLVASNKYVVGTLVVTVANGTMTVNYELNATQIKVNEETLTIYANLDALKNGMGLTATVGTPIDVAANFGEDTKVIVAFAAKADYNAVGAGVSSFKADDAQLAALIANID